MRIALKDSRVSKGILDARDGISGANQRQVARVTEWSEHSRIWVRVQLKDSWPDVEGHWRCSLVSFWDLVYSALGLACSPCPHCPSDN